MCKLATIQREIFSEIGRNLDWNVSSFEATLRRCNVICDLRCNVMFCIKSEKTSTEVMIQLKMTLTSTNDANLCMSVEKPAEKVGISIRSCHDISPFDDWTAGGKSKWRFLVTPWRSQWWRKIHAKRRCTVALVNPALQ